MSEAATIQEPITKLDRWKVARAQSLQRKGYTFSEIAEQMAVPRDLVVDALYYDAVRQ